MFAPSAPPGTMMAMANGQHKGFTSVEQLLNDVPVTSLINPHVNRLVILCKDGDGKVGLRVKSIDKGVFVALVTKGSPAAMGGLRFGDQILQINGENIAGFDEQKVHKIFKKAGVNNICLAVRDRPFERTLTLHKDSTVTSAFSSRRERSRLSSSGPRLQGTVFSSTTTWLR